jgi:hypothetical protein
MRQTKVHFGAALVAAVFLVVSGTGSPAPAQEETVTLTITGMT